MVWCCHRIVSDRIASHRIKSDLLHAARRSYQIINDIVLLFQKYDNTLLLWNGKRTYVVVLQQ